MFQPAQAPGYALTDRERALYRYVSWNTRVPPPATVFIRGAVQRLLRDSSYLAWWLSRFNDECTLGEAEAEDVVSCASSSSSSSSSSRLRRAEDEAGEEDRQKAEEEVERATEMAENLEDTAAVPTIHETETSKPEPATAQPGMPSPEEACSGRATPQRLGANRHNHSHSAIPGGAKDRGPHDGSLGF